MKRILTFLLTATLLAAIPTSLWAQKEKKTSSQRRMMTSDGPETNSGHKFVIDGKIALDVKDAKFNIYITDIDKEITMADFVGSVEVKDRKFRFETNLSTMKIGRLRPVMSDGGLGSAWIDIYFIPGFTIDLTIHNGYYDINNEQQYTFMTEAWLNKDALAVLFESMGAPFRKTEDAGKNNLQLALKPYQNLLTDLENQLMMLNEQPLPYYDEKQTILKRMDAINSKMQSIVDEYTKSLKF